MPPISPSSPMAGPAPSQPRWSRRRCASPRSSSRAPPGHFSAYGMLVAELRRDFVKTWFTPLAEASFPAMDNIYAEMERRGREAVARSDVAVAGIAVERSADMRYVGQ